MLENLLFVVIIIIIVSNYLTYFNIPGCGGFWYDSVTVKATKKNNLNCANVTLFDLNYSNKDFTALNYRQFANHRGIIFRPLSII